MTNHPIQNMLACIAIITFRLTSAYSHTDTIKSTGYEGLSVKIISGGKNILNERSREFFKSDDTPFLLLTGVNYEFYSQTASNHP